MYPLRKLAELSPRTRIRKIARLLQAAEVSLGSGRGCDREYLEALARLLPSGPGGQRPSGTLEQCATRLAAAASAVEPDAALLLRSVNAARHALLAAAEAEPAEWDLLAPEDGRLDRTAVAVLPISVYLEDLRSPFNVGSIFRTAEAFGAERVLISPSTPLPTHPRARRTARGAEEAVPWEVRELSGLEEPGSLFALELGGTGIDSFSFPRRGTVLVGSEELGLSPEALRLADAGLGRVTIRLAGAKRSLNVAVAFGILMHRWSEALRR